MITLILIFGFCNEYHVAAQRHNSEGFWHDTQPKWKILASATQLQLNQQHGEAHV